MANAFPLPSDPKLHVILNRSLPWGTVKELQRFQEGKKAEVDRVLFVEKVLQAGVAGWNVTDEGGEILPLTQENFDRRLQFEDVQAIVREVMEGLRKAVSQDPNSSTASSRGSRRTGRSR